MCGCLVGLPLEVESEMVVSYDIIRACENEMAVELFVERMRVFQAHTAAVKTAVGEGVSLFEIRHNKR